MRAPQQARSRAKVQAILDAARRRLQDDPEAPLTTRGLADDAGMAVATLYRYFNDVDDVLDVLVHEHAEASAAAVDQALVTADASVVEVYRAVLDAHLDLYRTRPELTRAWASPQLAARQAAVEQTTDQALARRVGAHLAGLRLVAPGPVTDARVEAHWAAAGALLSAVLAAPPSVRPALEVDLRAAVDGLARSLGSDGRGEQPSRSGAPASTGRHRR